jgi:hypothetical protein
MDTTQHCYCVEVLLLPRWFEGCSFYFLLKILVVQLIAEAELFFELIDV